MRIIRETRPTMHGSRAERKLMSGLGALIKQDASKVKVTGEKPAEGNRRPR